MNVILENLEEILKCANTKMIPYLYPIYKNEGELAMIQAAHELVDKAHKQSKTKENIICKAGCSHCCHSDIFLSQGEAKYILAQLKINPEIIPNKRRLKLQNKNKFKDLKHKDKKCSLLTPEGNCSIYPIRPIICRNHNSIDTSPEKCDRGVNSNRSVQIRRILDAEAIQMALLLIPQNKTYLHEALYQTYK